jgi:hypothetical protein
MTLSFIISIMIQKLRVNEQHFSFFLHIALLNRMEETFLRVKTERDELIKKNNRDSTDGKPTPTMPATIITEEIASLKTELKRQKAHYEAQFIEYVRHSDYYFLHFSLTSACNSN